MKLSTIYNNALNVTNNSSELRRELLTEFKPLIRNMVVAEESKSLLTVFNDASISLILNQAMFSFNNMEEFDDVFDKLTEKFPDEIDELIIKIKEQQINRVME